MKEIRLVGPLTRLPTRTRDGQRVFGIRGKPTGSHVPASATATIWITTGPTPLPVEYVTRAPHETFTVTLTRWGDAAVSVQPPATPTQT